MANQCWCGVKNPYFSDDLDTRCDGSGMLYCHCGGDLCVCHWHGEVQCIGCEDCEANDDRDNFGIYDDDLEAARPEAAGAQE